MCLLSCPSLTTSGANTHTHTHERFPHHHTSPPLANSQWFCASVGFCRASLGCLCPLSALWQRESIDPGEEAALGYKQSSRDTDARLNRLDETAYADRDVCAHLCSHERSWAWTRVHACFAVRLRMHDCPVCFVFWLFWFFSNVTARVYCRHCVATSSYLSLLLIQWVGHQARRGEKKENDLTPSCAFREEGLEACQLCSGSASPLCPSYFFPSARPKLWKYPP